MADHDQRFKELIREFFAQFIRLFLPDWAERFDFTALEWLQQEVFTDPPRGGRLAVDLVAKLPLRQPATEWQAALPEPWITLIHVEVEASDSVAPLRRRMYDYHWVLESRHDLPVLPIALYLRVGLGGVGWDVYEQSYFGRRFLYFEYPYVGLPGLDAFQYVEGPMVLGAALAVLMAVPDERRAELKAVAMERAARCGETPTAGRYCAIASKPTYRWTRRTWQNTSGFSRPSRTRRRERWL